MPEIELEVLLLTLAGATLKTLLVPDSRAQGGRRLPRRVWRDTEDFEECLHSLLVEVAPGFDVRPLAMDHYSRSNPLGLVTPFLLCVRYSAVSELSKSDHLSDLDDLQTLSGRHRDQLAFALRAVLDVRTPLLPSLLEEGFTLGQLQSVAESVLGTPLDKRHFRRELFEQDWLEETGEMSGGAHRPAKLYRVARRYRNGRA